MALGEVLLEKRPSAGIWGGLWSLPEIKVNTESDIGSAVDTKSEAVAKTGLLIETFEVWDTIRHTFSHYHLDIIPVKGMTASREVDLHADNQWLWCPLDQPLALGLAAPVKKLITKIKK